MSYVLKGNLIYAKQIEGKDDWTRTLIAKAKTIATGQGDFIQNPNEGWFRMRFRLSDSAVPGTWLLQGFAMNRQLRLSPMFGKIFHERFPFWSVIALTFR